LHDDDPAVVALALDFPKGAINPSHSHPRGQLVYTAHGMVTTTTEAGVWVAPPQRAVWVPAGVAHANRHSVGTQFRTIYLRNDAASGLPARCVVVQVSPLVRELLLAVMRLPRLYDERGADGRLVQVLIDRLAALPDEPLHLPVPTSRKLRAVAHRFVADPGVKRSLASAARSAAMSPRSFARHFRSETNLAFGAWQAQARLLRALELLGSGQSVGDVAFGLGYGGTSAFIAMFRRALGTTPSRYFEDGAKRG
jgi:AraC-like DNA-binding protein